MIEVVALGECMLELTHCSDRGLRLGYAGDTYNTAVHLRRASTADVRVSYLTAVGDDWYSDRLLEALEQEGLHPLVEIEPGGTPGLYLIRTDESGERSFTYHRHQSPATSLFSQDLSAQVLARVLNADLVHMSAISLQILSPEGRDRLLDVLVQARARGARISFDSNYRRAGWPSVLAAVQAIDRLAPVIDIALPTLDDEQVLHPGDSTEAIIDRYRRQGASEVVLKCGAKPSWLSTAGVVQQLPLPAQVTPVDTTGAGDAFDGAYLAARLAGRPPADAVRAAQLLAADVVAQPGAIPARTLPASPRTE